MVYEIGTEDMSVDYFFCERHIDVDCINHIHSHVEIVYVTEGCLKIAVDGKDCLLREGEMSIVMPYEIHSYETKEHSDMLVITFRPEFINEYRQMFSGFCFENTVCKISPVLKEMLTEYINSPCGHLQTKSIVYYSLSAFSANSRMIDKKPVEYDVYRKAIGYISEHYTEKITLEQTASHVGVTPVHLSRVLNSKGKSGFSEIVNSLRIFYARSMIEQTDHPVSYIAFEAGYGSIRNFNRMFSKYFGCSPKWLRSKNTKLLTLY